MISAVRVKTAVPWIVAIACGATLAHGADPAEAIEEYRLKAAFVSRFAGFVEWPPEVLKNSADPILICVLGMNPFGSALDQALNGKSIQDHKLAARHIQDAKQAAACQILFVSSSERNHFRSILKGMERSAILTVGDADNFISDGGVIGLELDGDRIRIVVNIDAAEQARLRISSKLLGLARIVRK